MYESLAHAGIAMSSRVIVRKIEAEDVEREGAEYVLGGMDGILVPGGFGYRGIPGKIEAICRWRASGRFQFFGGICLGLAMRRHRIRPQCGRFAGRQHHRDRPQLPASGGVPAGRAI